MNRSEQINELGAALAKAQHGMENAAKDKANPFFKSKYADLASVWEACRGPLSSNGLSVVQLPRFADGVVTVETILLHASGQWIGTELSAPVKEQTAQAVGSVVTYLRRYSLASMAGVAPDDDDGNAGSSRTEQEEQRGAQRQEAPPEKKKPDPTQASAEKVKVKMISAKGPGELAVIDQESKQLRKDGIITEAQLTWLGGVRDKRLKEIAAINESAPS
jgi:ERF superfamily